MLPHVLAPRQLAEQMTKKLVTFLDMIRFEHTVFALPFAYLGMVLAWETWDYASWWDFLWITIAMAAARTSAMAFNRYIDRYIDTLNRHL